MAQRHQDDVVFSHSTSGHISGGHGTPKTKHKLKKKGSPFRAPSPRAARAHNLLVQADAFLDTAHSEVYAIEGAMKNLRHALDAFQIHMCADTEFLKVARMKADLMDMLDSVKNTSTVLEGSATRLQKAINVGKRGVHANQSALQRTQTSRGGLTLEVLDMDHHHAMSRTWSEKSLTASNSSGSFDVPATPTYTPLTLWETLFPTPGTATLPKDDVAVVLDKLAFQSKPALGKKDVLVFFRELIHWSLVNNHKKMSFLDRSQNKNHSTRYASILTSAAWDELRSQQLLSHDGAAEQRRKPDDLSDELGDSPPAAESLTPPQLEAFTTSATFAHMAKTISAKLNFASSPPKSAATCCATPPKDLASSAAAAENTLSMAKLLHDLANAESEAKNGFKLSVRTNAVRSKEFSKAFLTASKDLLEKETGLY